ncbi:MAG: hydroxyethylthiazole kinase [Spirochaetaceae bacterium]|jgi:hydroxyethylthiazole kinase|nr:hydroxyethylthiazole kinase [Spirochaetaceae bacterium]
MKDLTKKAASIVDAVRRGNPLVDCITNYVTVNDCANILLAFGASPAMCDALDVAYDFAKIAGSLYINFGTYLKEQEAAAVQAAQAAKAAGIPIVVDPVGCAAIPKRIGLLQDIHRAGGVSIIKGNMGEIGALAAAISPRFRVGAVKGVDSASEMAGIDEAARAVAEKYGCVVAATGKIDVVTDGKRLVKVENGVEMLKLVTGAGCMLGALCGATSAAAKDDPLDAAVAAIVSLCIAGEMAAAKARFPGSFRVALMDSIFQVDGAMIREKGRIHEE